MDLEKYAIKHIDDVVFQFNTMVPDVLLRVSEEIRAFNAIDLKLLDDARIAQTVSRLTGVYAMLPFYLKDDIELWRARASKRSEKFLQIAELLYPPTQYAGLGRANIAGASIFYAASSPETCFAECRLEVGSIFHLARCRLRSNKQQALLRVGDLDKIRRGIPLNNEAMEANYRDIFARLRPDVALAMQLVDAFFFDHMTRKGSPDQYAVTSAIATDLMDSQGIVGLIFESVEHQGGYNFALRPGFCDKQIDVMEISIQRIAFDLGYGARQTAVFGPVEVDGATGTVMWPEISDWPEQLDRAADIARALAGRLESFVDR